MSIILVSSLFSLGLFVPSFASPYAVQNPIGTNSTSATSSGNLASPNPMVKSP
ncbi:hypothetical protein [Candidatus Nitrosotalea bavarica]|uniref:hypothetical protein n=1 Tax=Candidatus Nitrosotalea bavarica TaxID=1903277 RepID=UPI0013FDC162|nr:hypothetical protein [Candidatus Nitrosotalea bavarica]